MIVYEYNKHCSVIIFFTITYIMGNKKKIKYMFTFLTLIGFYKFSFIFYLRPWSPTDRT